LEEPNLRAFRTDLKVEQYSLSLTLSTRVLTCRKKTLTNTHSTHSLLYLYWSS